MAIGKLKEGEKETKPEPKTKKDEEYLGISQKPKKVTDKKKPK